MSAVQLSNPATTLAPVDLLQEKKVDRFGNAIADGLPYARGNLIRGTPDDLNKVKRAERLAKRHMDAGRSVYNFTGLERNITKVMHAEAIPQLDDCWAPAICGDDLKKLGLEHLGGNPEEHDCAVITRQTAAIHASMLVLLEPGDLVIGVAPTYTHPCLIRAVKLAGGHFIETNTLSGFQELMHKHADEVKCVAITRLAVTYDIIPNDDLTQIVSITKNHPARPRIFVDDAGGGRVGPAFYQQPRTLELDADLGSTGLDKYGTLGPRVGLMGGKKEWVSKAWAKAVELGCECRQMLYPAVVNTLRQYKEQNVTDLVETTMIVGEEMSKLFDKNGVTRVRNNGLIAQLKGEDLLEMMLERRGLDLRTHSRIIVPFEATAMVAVALMERHGIYSVNLAAIPSGTTSLMIKFVPKDTLEKFGGAAAFARAIDDCIDSVAAIIDDPAACMRLLGRPEEEIVSAPSKL